MAWNWQLPEWPEFEWDPERLTRAEERFLLYFGQIRGITKHLGGPDGQQILVEAISTEALTTSEIEGEVLDRASVQSSIRKHLGLKADKHRPKPAEEGVAEMTVDLYRTFSEPLTKETLFRWHGMLMKGRRDILRVGQYRNSREPMEIVSGAIYAPKVHFEAPPSSSVPKEMKEFVAWFNRTAPGGAAPLPALTRAGLAHIYFESIHPFEDGNGRIGRALSEKALSQAVEQPSLTALAATILVRRKAYYKALEYANKRSDVTEWLAWFAGTVLEAQIRTETRIEFVLGKSRLLEKAERVGVNDRQKKAIARILKEGPDGFQGGLSAGNYASITGASPATTTRDLVELVEHGLLRREGERRHARYFLTIPTREIPLVAVAGSGEIREAA
ncbi:cell division protein Fic [Bryobacterales bacterium F-183]|nr:cell division protein Fic [Bryobacterales bacterium F-183]